MAKWLQKNEPNTPILIAYLYDTPSRYRTNAAILTGEIEGAACSCTHAVISYKREYLDCEGGINLTDYLHIQHITDLDFLVKTILNKGDWCSYFDRGHISYIEVKLNIDLSEIKE